MISGGHSPLQLLTKSEELPSQRASQPVISLVPSLCVAAYVSRKESGGSTDSLLFSARHLSVLAEIGNAQSEKLVVEDRVCCSDFEVEAGVETESVREKEVIGDADNSES